jgi:hypothetical protein
MVSGFTFRWIWAIESNGKPFSRVLFPLARDVCRCRANKLLRATCETHAREQWRWVPMKKTILAIIVISFGTTVAAEEFTAAELKQVQAIRTSLENSCREELNQKIQTLPKDAPAIAKWISRIADSDAYCVCASDRFSKNLTPDILRHGTEEQGAALVKQSGTECVVPRLKSTFSEFCSELVSEIPGADRSAETARNNFCRCLQSDIDLVTTQSFEAFVSNTISEYRTYQQTQKIPAAARGTSLLSSMQHCGLEGLKPTK